MTDIIYATGSNAMGQLWTERYEYAKAVRMPLEADWRNVARFGLARHYSRWITSSTMGPAANPGAARQARIDSFDSTLGRAINTYQAVCERMMTPGTKQYHRMDVLSDRLKRSRPVMLWCEQLNRSLFRYRYSPHAKFIQTQGELYISYGAYGNAGKLITWRKPEPKFSRAGGFSYRSIPFADLFWIVDGDGIIRTWFRRIRWTAKQAADDLKEKCPKDLVDKAKTKEGNDPNQTYEFFQVVTPAEDYEEGTLDRRRYPLVSLYIYVKEKNIVRDPEGFRSNPLVTPRHFTDGDSPYGFGPAQIVLSSTGVANAQVRSELRYNQRASEPPLLTRDDGVVPDLRPGKTTPGAMTADGKPLVKAIDLGNFQINDKSIEITRDDIKDPLFGKIFDIVKDRPQRSIPEVLDDIGREASMLAPTMGRLYSEDLAIMIEREIALLAENNALPENVPHELLDEHIEPEHTSPLALALKSEAVGGYFRMIETTANTVKMTGDPSALKLFALKRALPDIADLTAIPPSWMSTPEEVAADAAAQKQQQQSQQAVDALPGIAGLMKAGSDNNLKPGPGAPPQ